MRSHQEPKQEYLLTYAITLSIGALLLSIYFKQAERPRALLRSWGVSVRKVARAAREIERKTFHLCGLLVPLIHQFLLSRGVVNQWCVRLCMTITGVGLTCDMARLNIPFVARNWPMNHILRDHELRHVTGASFFSAGCTMAIGDALHPRACAHRSRPRAHARPQRSRLRRLRWRPSSS
jgi:hypothetical protein